MSNNFKKNIRFCLASGRLKVRDEISLLMEA